MAKPGAGLDRPLTPRQAVLGGLVAGWLGAFAIMLFGEKQVSGQWPSSADLLQNAGIAIVFAPVLALAAWWKSRHFRRKQDPEW